MVDEVKPSSTEDEYFAREQAEQLRKLAIERNRRLAEDEKRARRDLHYMHCPKCGDQLQTVQLREIEVDHCFSCGGTWLDAGELDRLGRQEKHGVMAAVLNIFKGK